jgi:hypothetical protein
MDVEERVAIVTGAHEELAALPASRRAALPPLIPAADVLAVVLALVADSASGTVVTLVGRASTRSCPSSHRLP